MARAGYRVTAPDLRGHGDSPPGEDYFLASYAADVLALAYEWDVVVGHSLGGAIAAIAQTKNREFAGRLVLEDPVLSLSDPNGFIAEYTKPFEDPSAAAILAQNPRWHPQDARIKAEARTTHRPGEPAVGPGPHGDGARQPNPAHRGRYRSGRVRCSRNGRRNRDGQPSCPVPGACRCRSLDAPRLLRGVLAGRPQLSLRMNFQTHARRDRYGRNHRRRKYRAGFRFPKYQRSRKR
jgi:pimeloyl-ACP methyl ester carboxylesterase